MNTKTITLRITTSKQLPDNIGDKILNRIHSMHCMEGAEMEVVDPVAAPQPTAAEPATQKSSLPMKPLDLVQVTLPDGNSAMLQPERAYFDFWAMLELESKLRL